MCPTFFFPFDSAGQQQFSSHLMLKLSFYSANSAGGMGNINNENTATDSKNLKVKVCYILPSLDYLYDCYC